MRALSSATEMLTLPYPEDAVDNNWFKDVFHYLNIDLGPEYLCLVARWVDLARSHGWKNSKGRLPTKDRPNEVGKWISGGRYRSKQASPKISASSVSPFVEFVWKWWTKMQPDWRALAADARPILLTDQCVIGSFQSLDISGTNGWLSVVACAKWWGLALQHHVADKDGDLKSDWLKAVVDFAETLAFILKSRS
jgi:hypothetical protein